MTSLPISSSTVVNGKEPFRRNHQNKDKTVKKDASELKLIQGDPQMNRQTTTTKKQHFQGAFLFSLAFAVAYPIPPAFAQRESGDQPLVQSAAQWVWQNPLPQGNHLFGLSFTDANNGTAVGLHGTILRTTDGGHHWIIQSSGTTNWLYGVSFVDANNGTAVGVNGTILKTADGGQSWVSQTSGTTNALLAVSFTDANTGTAVGREWDNPQNDRWRS